MALQTSGPISLANIQAEFGGSNPISLSEYYGAASGVPTSGTISLSNFYGKSNVFQLTLSGTSTTNVYSTAISAGWDGSKAIVVTVPSSLTIVGSTSAVAAVDFTGGAFPNGATLINNGKIYGRGGNGGRGANGHINCYDYGAGPGVQGATGGDAIRANASYPLIIVNNGTIGSGGGGGWGGSSSQLNVGGGGAGGGVPYGLGAAGGTGGGGGGSAGTNATLTVAGNGGAGAYYYSGTCGYQWSSAGGEGGGLGQQGWRGSTSASGYNDRWQQTGGLAGYAVLNYGSVTSFTGNALIGRT